VIRQTAETYEAIVSLVGLPPIASGFELDSENSRRAVVSATGQTPFLIDIAVVDLELIEIAGPK
jgi:hypothetical protein